MHEARNLGNGRPAGCLRYINCIYTHFFNTGLMHFIVYDWVREELDGL